MQRGRNHAKREIMTGLTRIRINSNWHDWRHELSEDMEPMSNEIIRQALADYGMPIMDGEDRVECTKNEAIARYDHQNGIDMLLTHGKGPATTLQEKILTYKESTATFEEKKSSGKDGAWYYCTANYYFVGYNRAYNENQPRSSRVLQFDDWILLDLVQLKRLDSLGVLNWKFNGNKRDGRRATFRYLYFNEIPTEAVIARMATGIQRKLIWRDGQWPLTTG